MVLSTILDSIVSGARSAKDFSDRMMTGTGGSGRGLIDLFLLKNDMLHYMLSVSFEKLGLPSDVLVKMSDVLATHKSWRQQLRTATDLSWQKDWPSSATRFLPWSRRSYTVKNMISICERERDRAKRLQMYWSMI